MSKFLYGAAVQGIQGFILQTNKLREIVGASEMVARICTAQFAELLGIDATGDDLTKALESEKRFILHAAGNVKYIFDERDQCARVVREFPKKVMAFAPGITISQAVVEYDNGVVNTFQEAVDLLENRLRIQRNRPFRSQTLGLMGIRRSRQTGLPVTRTPKDDDGVTAFLDEATFYKRRVSMMDLCKRAFGDEIRANQVAMDVSDIANGDNNWIAVIHADGNGLGRIVQKVGGNPEEFKRFSEELDKDTVGAARDAFVAVKDKIGVGKIPIRPIVLSGDDLTVICRADLALDYTYAFINAFEKRTAGIFRNKVVFTSGPVRDRMTACAGIAFVKASYPYYYAYDLAEDLCTEAKRDAKDSESIKSGAELPMSSVLFYKVQDSFYEDYGEIVKRELSPTDGVCLQFGPYYISPKKDRWTVLQLKEAASKLDDEEGNAVKSTVRRWLSALHEEPEMAKQLLNRAKMFYSGSQNQVLKTATTPIDGRVPAFDLLAIHAINTQVTK